MLSSASTEDDSSAPEMASSPMYSSQSESDSLEVVRDRPSLTVGEIYNLKQSIEQYRREIKLLDAELKVDLSKHLYSFFLLTKHDAPHRGKYSGWPKCIPLKWKRNTLTEDQKRHDFDEAFDPNAVEALNPADFCSKQALQVKVDLLKRHRSYVLANNEIPLPRIKDHYADDFVNPSESERKILLAMNDGVDSPQLMKAAEMLLFETTAVSNKMLRAEMQQNEIRVPVENFRMSEDAIRDVFAVVNAVLDEMESFRKRSGKPGSLPGIQLMDWRHLIMSMFMKMRFSKELTMSDDLKIRILEKIAKLFMDKGDFDKAQKKAMESKVTHAYACPYCRKSSFSKNHEIRTFSKPYNLRRHMRDVHGATLQGRLSRKRDLDEELEEETKAALATDPNALRPEMPFELDPRRAVMSPAQVYITERKKLRQSAEASALTAAELGELGVGNAVQATVAQKVDSNGSIEKRGNGRGSGTVRRNRNSQFLFVQQRPGK